MITNKPSPKDNRKFLLNPKIMTYHIVLLLIGIAFRHFGFNVIAATYLGCLTGSLLSILLSGVRVTKTKSLIISSCIPLAIGVAFTYLDHFIRSLI